MVDQVIQREFEGAWLNLVSQHHWQETRASINELVARHRRHPVAAG